MADKPQSSDIKPGITETGGLPSASRPVVAGGPGAGSVRDSGGPAHRGADMRDAMAVMAERAQLIGQEAGTKISAAMKDVIGAAAGLAGFAVESARDLVQYMVRRGQMSQDEADRLIRDAEEAHGKRTPAERARSGTKPAADRTAPRENTQRESSHRESAHREGGHRESGHRESIGRTDRPPAAVVTAASSAKSVPTTKSDVAKKQAPASAASKPAKKAAAKRPSAEKKAAPKKPAAKKRR